MPRRSARIARKNDGHGATWLERIGQWWSKSNSNPKAIEEYVDRIRFTPEEKRQKEQWLWEEQQNYVRKLFKKSKNSVKASELKKKIEYLGAPENLEQHLDFIRILFDYLIQFSRDRNETYSWIATFCSEHKIQPPERTKPRQKKRRSNRKIDSTDAKLKAGF